MKRNPFAPHVPCHRVIASDLSLGGFYGSTGNSPEVIRKRQMLIDEGVTLDARGKINCNHLMTEEDLIQSQLDDTL